MVDRPIGRAIADAIGNDLVRGVVATDALIGTFARLDDPSLQQNVCFLYHLHRRRRRRMARPGRRHGRGERGAGRRGASGSGAEIITGAEVYAIDPNGEVRYRTARRRARGARPIRVGRRHTRGAGRPARRADHRRRLPGAQVKVNMVLRRLPRLRDDSVTPEQAFGGTLHVNETWTQLDAAYSRAAARALPDPLPCEIYCHSLTDPSILSPALRESGAADADGVRPAHAALAFGDDEPDRCVTQLTDAVLTSLNSVLAEPIQDVLMDDAQRPAAASRRRPPWTWNTRWA